MICPIKCETVIFNKEFLSYVDIIIIDNTMKSYRVLALYKGSWIILWVFKDLKAAQKYLNNIYKQINITHH